MWQAVSKAPVLMMKSPRQMALISEVSTDLRVARTRSGPHTRFFSFFHHFFFLLFSHPAPRSCSVLFLACSLHLSFIHRKVLAEACRLSGQRSTASLPPPLLFFCVHIRIFVLTSSGNFHSRQEELQPAVCGRAVNVITETQMEKAPSSLLGALHLRAHRSEHILPIPARTSFSHRGTPPNEKHSSYRL